MKMLPFIPRKSNVRSKTPPSNCCAIGYTNSYTNSRARTRATPFSYNPFSNAF